MKEDMYITLVSMNHFFGVKPFKKDGILKLIKEKDNNYDDEAIKVEMRHAGQVAYVSNSTNTVIRGTMSAGRIYDKILDEEISIIIITQVLANEIRNHINRKIGSSVLPMIIEIPDKDGSSEGSSDQMADLIKRVIGVEMVK